MALCWTWESASIFWKKADEALASSARNPWTCEWTNTEAHPRPWTLSTHVPSRNWPESSWSTGRNGKPKELPARIVQVREKEPITTSGRLAEVVASAITGKPGRIHPATRVFQALRIHVNGELAHLEKFLKTCLDCLLPGGRLCVISFHSLEDRIVKRHFAGLAQGCTCPPDFPVCICGNQPKVKLLTRKVVKPTPAEVETNPMSRSAKIRAIEKLALEGPDTRGHNGWGT